MLVQVVIAVLIMLMLGAKAYFKAANPFWSRMPVQHTHDPFCFLWPTGPIQPGGPIWDKWNDPDRVDVIPYLEASQATVEKFCSFIREHYLNTPNLSFRPSDKQVASYFKGCSSRCYLSFYIDTQAGGPASRNNVGVLSTRPLDVSIGGTTMTVHYSDLLCVHPEYRGRSISPVLIQTQTYRARTDHPGVQVCLFKRENSKGMCIVPLTEYSVRCFDTTHWDMHLDYPVKTSLLPVTRDNFFKVRHVFKDQVKKRFDCLVAPSLDQLVQLIDSRVYYVFMHLVEDRLASVFFFKDGAVMRDSKRTVECVASSRLDSQSDEEFIHGFLQCVLRLKRKFPFLSIEETSDNNVLSNYLRGKYDPAVVTSSSLYFYNYRFRTVSPDKCLILE